MNSSFNVYKLVLSTCAIVTLGYVYYVRRCYGYLKSLGYDGPPPTFPLGNIAEFQSPANSVKEDENGSVGSVRRKNKNKPSVSHYSKTLQRWTKTYGKIYGYYEGHSPVIVLADVDLVTEVFINQSKLHSYRRSFPMSKESHEVDSNIFINNGIRWLRVRYGLEKIMLNNKNVSRCLEYVEESFRLVFLKQSDLKKPQKRFSISKRSKLFMMRTMFSVLFGTDFDDFINQQHLDFSTNRVDGVDAVDASNHQLPPSNTSHQRNSSFASQLDFDLNTTTSASNDSVTSSTVVTTSESSSSASDKAANLTNASLVADKFQEAFDDFESFSLLKLMAMLIPELMPLWRGLEKSKELFNRHILYVPYFADPMNWIYVNFLNRHLALYTRESQNNTTPRQQQRSAQFSAANAKARGGGHLGTNDYLSNLINQRRFGLLNSFLALTMNPIIKYHQNESPYKRISVSKEPSAASTPISAIRRPLAWSTSTNNENKENKRPVPAIAIEKPATSNFKSTPRAPLEESTSRVNNTSNSLSAGLPSAFKQRHKSTGYTASKKRENSAGDGGSFSNLNSSKSAKQQMNTSNIQLNDIESDDFENWKLTINEALSNTLLMFFAGFETTSSAIAFCCYILSTHPEQREKLLEEIKENWQELNLNLKKQQDNESDFSRASHSSASKNWAMRNLSRNSIRSSFIIDKIESDDERSQNGDAKETMEDDDDDVFGDTKDFTPPDAVSAAATHKTPRASASHLGGHHHHFSPFSHNMLSNADRLNNLNDTIEKMKYLDMFVKEALRMFPIATSMVSRKCDVDNLRIGHGNYYIPKGTNIVVDVLSIHYDESLWGPVDPHEFYPERFLAQRNPAAWLPFGAGCRKCIGIKFAMSQIKLFIVRLLQHYNLDKPGLKAGELEHHERGSEDLSLDELKHLLRTRAAKTRSSTANATAAAGNDANIKEKPFKTLETKDVLFAAPLHDVEVAIEPKQRLSF